MNAEQQQIHTQLAALASKLEAGTLLRDARSGKELKEDSPGMMARSKDIIIDNLNLTVSTQRHAEDKALGVQLSKVHVRYEDDTETAVEQKMAFGITLRQLQVWIDS